MARLQRIVREVRERRLLPVAIVYLGAGWGLAQVIDFAVENNDLSRRLLDVVVYLLVVGFPAALVIGWFHGRSGPQRPPRAEVALLSAVLLAALAGGWRIATAEAPAGRELELATLAPAALGDGSVAASPS